MSVTQQVPFAIAVEVGMHTPAIFNAVNTQEQKFLTAAGKPVNRAIRNILMRHNSQPHFDVEIYNLLTVV